MRNLAPAAGLLIAALALSGCDSAKLADAAVEANASDSEAEAFAYGFWSEVLEVFEGPRPWPNERRILSRDWVAPQVEAKVPPVYCYRTLGEVDCHAAPLADEENRIVNSFGPGTK